MVDIGAHRKFVGNVCLYRGVAVRKPRPFLQRNLNAVLDAHDRLLQSPASATPFEAMVANEKRSAGWDYPTEVMLRELVKGEKPVVRLDALQIRLTGEEHGGHWQTTQHSHDDPGLEWLPNPTDDLRLPCQVTVNVLDTRSSKQKIYARPCQGTITRRHNTNGGYYFDVTLDTPFLIELDKLFVQTESGTNGFRHWKRTVTVKYMLEVILQCQDSDDSAELLSKLESREASHYRNAPANEGTLRAVWSDLPACPPTGHLLQLRRAHGHKSIELKYGMELSMGWARRKDSPLEVYNRTRLVGGQHQLPTPTASDDLDKATPKQFVVRYMFQEGMQLRAHTQDGLNCIWCGEPHGAEGKSQSRAFGPLPTTSRSIDRLLLHYMTCHNHFTFVLDDVTSAHGKELVSITMSLTEKPPGQNLSGKLADEEHSWIAPQKPFDISAHVAGDESWVTGVKPKPAAKRGPGRPPKSKEDAEPGAAPLPTNNRKRPSLHEVEDLPVPKKRKFRVPKVERVTFYHTLSKQPILPGEELSESDDEMYDSRLARSQRRNFTEFGLSETACNFNEAFNQHLDLEQSASVVLLREAIVRFARKYEVKLQSGEWRREFEAKLRQLRSHGIIGDDVIAFCLHTQSSAETGRITKGHGEKQDNPPPYDERSHDEVYAMDSADGATNSRPRVKGRFASSSDLGSAKKEEQVLGGRFTNSTSGNYEDRHKQLNSLSPITKKPHRWSGTGADKDILDAGRTFRSDNAGPEPPAAQPTRADSSKVHNKAGSTPVKETPPPRNHRFRWDQGAFINLDDDPAALLSPAAGSLRASGTPKPRDGVATSQENGIATNGIRLKAHRDDAKGLPPIGYCKISCTRRGGTNDRSSFPFYYTAYAFAGDGAPQSIDKLEVDDIVFGYFVEKLQTDGLCEKTGDILIWQGGGRDGVEILDGEAWRDVLRDWQTKRLCDPIRFEVRSRTKMPDPQQSQSRSTLNTGADRKHHEAQQPQPSGATMTKKKGICVCSKPAEGGRGCIACDNQVSLADVIWTA